MLELTTLAGLAVFSLIVLLQDTAGPADLFLHIRIWLKVDLPIYNGSTIIGYERDIYPSTFLAKLYGCSWCLGTWLALFISLGYILAGLIPLGLGAIVWMASLGIAQLAYTVYQKV